MKGVHSSVRSSIRRALHGCRQKSNLDLVSAPNSTKQEYFRVTRRFDPSSVIVNDVQGGSRNETWVGRWTAPERMADERIEASFNASIAACLVCLSYRHSPDKVSWCGSSQQVTSQSPRRLDPLGTSTIDRHTVFHDDS
jgi:hypothetical protein